MAALVGGLPTPGWVTAPPVAQPGAAKLSASRSEVGDTGMGGGVLLTLMDWHKDAERPPWRPVRLTRVVIQKIGLTERSSPAARQAGEGERSWSMPLGDRVAGS